MNMRLFHRLQFQARHFLEFLFIIIIYANCYVKSSALVNITVPPLVLNHVEFSTSISLVPYINGSAWPKIVNYEVFDNSNQSFRLGAGKMQTIDEYGNAVLENSIDGLGIQSSGFYQLIFRFTCPENGCPQIEILKEIHSMPGYLSLTPPLLTVIIAVILKQVYIALVFGIWLGCIYIYNFNPLVALLRTFDTYFARVINYQSGHAQVVVFCFLLGGLIGIVQKGGGAQGLGSFVTRFTTTRFRALLASMLLNFLIFFDDYSAILIVGTTFSKITQSLYISKEKFAFLIHGISACFVSIVPISSWVGVQIGYIQGEHALNAKDPFIWFLQSIPYRFFPLLWIGFIVIIIATGRDFGVMYEREHECYRIGIEKRSRRLASGVQFSPMLKLGVSGDKEDMGRRISQEEISEHYNMSAPSTESNGPLVPKPGTPLDRWYNAAIPFTVVAIATFLGMYFDGIRAIHHMADKHQVPCDMINIFTYANSFNALMWGSMFGCMTALVLLLSQRILTLGEAMDAWVSGIAENILAPIIILLLAWALGQVINDISASTYLAKSIGTSISPTILPAIVTVLCFVMSFSTGTAFGSMGIMFPLILPLASSLGNGSQNLLEHCVGSILGGSLFGNVLSPIADDTILASMASGVTVTEHVSSMFHYVILVAFVSIVFGSIPVGYGWYSPSLALVISLGVLLFVVMIFGRKVNKKSSTKSKERKPLLPIK